MSLGDFAVTFSPESGSIRIRAPYDGDRHHDTWVEHTLGAQTKTGAVITYWTYPDGQFIALEMNVAHAGLVVETWGKPTRRPSK